MCTLVGIYGYMRNPVVEVSSMMSNEGRHKKGEYCVMDFVLVNIVCVLKYIITLIIGFNFRKLV